VAQLETISLDDNQTIWTDEFNWSPVGQSEETDIHGGLVVEWISPNADGRPVTLDLGWITKTTLDAIVALRDAETQSIMALTLPDAREIDVLFRHADGNPVSVTAVVDRPEYASEDLFAVVLNLMQVLP